MRYNKFNLYCNYILKNKELQERIKQQENQFQLFIDNAKEIVLRDQFRKRI